MTMPFHGIAGLGLCGKIFFRCVAS